MSGLGEGGVTPKDLAEVEALWGPIRRDLCALVALHAAISSPALLNKLAAVGNRPPAVDLEETLARFAHEVAGEMERQRAAVGAGAATAGAGRPCNPAEGAPAEGGGS